MRKHTGMVIFMLSWASLIMATVSVIIVFEQEAQKPNTWHCEL